MEVDKPYKVTLRGAQTCSVANIQVQLCIFFDATSCVNIDCIDHSCVRLASSVEQVSELKSKGIGFKSHVRLTVCLEYILCIVNMYHTTLHPIQRSIIRNSKFQGFTTVQQTLSNIKHKSSLLAFDPVS